MDRDSRADCVRWGDEHHQFHGRDQRDHGRVCIGGSGAAGVVECAARLHGAVIPGGGDSGRFGVLLVQFPPEGQGEVFRGGCRQHRDCVHYAVCHWPAYRADGGCNLSCAAAGVWRGRLPDDCASHYAARAPGTGAPQARVSAARQRAGLVARDGVAALYGAATGRVAGVHLPLPADRGGALDLPACCGRGTLRRLCIVHEEVLPSARGVSGVAEEGLGRDRVGTFGGGIWGAWAHSPKGRFPFRAAARLE